MTAPLRRFLVIAGLMFWQGGFTFYGAVVVPVGQEVLGSHTNQGFITREVSNCLNLAGAIILSVLVWDAAVTRDHCRRRCRWRWFALFGLAVTLGLLVLLHLRLDKLLDADAFRILDRKTFRREHRWYLWISTVQWGLALLYLLLTIWTWRGADRAAPERAGHQSGFPI
jgi:hypothetical protein